LSTVSTHRAIDVSQVLDDPHTPRTSWSISDALAVELFRHLERRRPRRILEIGSGLSTVVLGAYAARHSASVVTLEHAWKFYERTRKGLVHFGLDEQVQLKLAPLRSKRFERYGQAPWYDTKLSGQFDFVFVDGPPKDTGRNAVLFAIAKHLTPGWELWMDDARRHHEQNCLRRWRQRFPAGSFRVQRRDVDSKGLVVLSDARPQRSDWLGIALVVNGDPTWPRRAERCLGPDLLLGSFVVATSQAAASTEFTGFVNSWAVGDGDAVRLLARRPGLRYVLRLDDHWSNSTDDTTWLARAMEILERRPDVELVCLQHWIDNDRRHARDEAQRGFIELGHTPFPEEPALFRAAALSRLADTWPAGVAVQLLPGAFCRMHPF
jgi:predicted O-methyltransferase YrrM